MGSLVTAYVHAIVKRGTEQSVATQIQAMNGVTEVRVTDGLDEALVRARLAARSMEHLDQIVTQIQQIEGISQTSILLST